MPVRIHPRTRLQLSRAPTSPLPAAVPPLHHKPLTSRPESVSSSRGANQPEDLDEINALVSPTPSPESSATLTSFPSRSNTLTLLDHNGTDNVQGETGSLDQLMADLQLDTPSPTDMETDVPQNDITNEEEKIESTWDESMVLPKKKKYKEHPYITFVDSPVPPENEVYRPNGLFTHNVVPMIGACISLRGGAFYDGTGNRPKKAPEEIMKDHRAWLGKKKEYDRMAMMKRRKRTEPWAARASRKLEADQDAGFAEHYIPNTLSADKEEEVFAGLDEVMTGPYIDDAMELTITCSYEGPWSRPPEVPQAVLDLQGLKLPTRLYQNMVACKIEELLPVQRQVIPLVQRGFDVIGISPTGTGKTACFLVPIIQGIYGDKITAVAQNEHSRLRALIITPTRELAAQIQENAVRLSYGLNVTSFALYGAIDFEYLERKLSEKPDILIATPGRLKEVMERNMISVFYVRYVVVDEVDRMMVGNGFTDLTWIFNHGTFPTLDKRQTLFFSATISDAQTHFLKKHQYNPFVVRVGVVGPIAVVKQSFERTKGFYEKLNQLHVYLEKAATENLTVIIFTNSKNGLSRLASEMKSYAFAQHHSGLSQAERAESLRIFTTKEVSILLTTDVSSRGLDIEEVGLIINFHTPPSVTDYIHRIGRTGRKGHGGEAVTFFEAHGRRDMMDLGPLMNLLKSCNVEIPSWLDAEVSMAYQTYGLSRPEDDTVMQTANDLADLGVYLHPDVPAVTSAFKAGF